MGKIILVPFALLLVALAVLALVGLAMPAAETRKIEAETERTDAEAGLAEVEAAAERDRKLLELVQELVDVTRRQNAELLALVRELTTREDSAPAWAVLAVASSAFSALALLVVAGVLVLSMLRGDRLALPYRRRERLPESAYTVERQRRVDVVVIPPPRIEG